VYFHVMEMRLRAERRMIMGAFKVGFAAGL